MRTLANVARPSQRTTWYLGTLLGITVIILTSAVYFGLHKVVFRNTEPHVTVISRDQNLGDQGVILFLLPPPSHYRWAPFWKSMDLLEQNYLKGHPSEVLFLHEGLPDGLQDEVKKHLLSATNITYSHWGINASVIPSDYPPQHQEWMRHDTIGTWPLGYKYMCWFFTGKVFDHPALQKYKYYWRLDTDSFVLEEIKYDIFERMRERGCYYGYRFITHEGPPVTNDLWQTFINWTVTMQFPPPHNSWVWRMISPRYDFQEYTGFMFYNNFEVVDIEWFKNDDYRSLFKTLEDAGGFWHWRWGDAPIRTLGIGYLMEPEKICLMGGFCYDHQSNRCEKGEPRYTDFGFVPPA